jgi:hypothetical protein
MNTLLAAAFQPWMIAVAVAIGTGIGAFLYMQRQKPAK